MIKKLDIPKFGLFNNFQWDASVGKNETFRRLNIIYGRNYSGKTTLSRIFKSIEDNEIPINYDDSEFEVEFLDGKTIHPFNLSEIDKNFSVRVYNSDFVKENLSWLHNDDGTIEPFTILGATNVEIENKLKEIDDKIGTVENGNGLLFELIQTFEIQQQKNKAFVSKKEDLENKLRDKARGIKNAAPIFNQISYSISSIQKDIPKAQKSGILPDEQIQEKRRLLKDESKGTIDRLSESKPNFTLYYNQTNDLLKKKIKPSEPILELVNNSLLQEWVRLGIDKHRNKRNTCGFCGNPINDNLWEKLDAHFSKESEELRKDIKVKIDFLEQAKINLGAFINLEKNLFYANLTSRFDEVLKKWNTTTKTYSKSIDKLISELKEREKDIFKERELAEITDVSETIFETLQEFNILIDEHNSKTNTLGTDQETARNELRLSEVAKFLNDIDYKSWIDSITHLEIDLKTSELEHKTKQDEIDRLNEEKRILEAQAKDESRGAELVNQHLSHFFGHSELKLVAEGESLNLKFKIMREEEYAKNLSEGECSLISFCYFIARMEDELKDEVNSKKLIIYIDDPISSLDSNHIFFMFSLIESVIAKDKKYCQLFISTHNLDFLKYLKKLTRPKYKKVPGQKEKEDDINYFLIERKNKNHTNLRLSPNYLKKYITEFNYLFCQIYNCSISNSETIGHDYQYNFGNNMRKFLEAFLFYKYPNNNLSNDQRLEKFFKDDNITLTLVKRITNEYSHLENQFDRSIEPIDVDAIKKVSLAVMNKIEMVDKEQYDSLLESTKGE